MCEIRFSVLGPFEASCGGRPIAIPRGRQRVLLAILILNANDVVSVDELTDRLWDDRLPRRPYGALQTCLTRLRHWLDVHEEGASKLVRTSSGGYVMETCPQNLDLLRFRQSLRAATAARARGDLAVQSAALSEALSLWREPILSNVQSDSLRRETVPRLTEDYLRALEWRHDVELALGRHGELIGGLRSLTRKHPFQERFWKQLMLALCRSGRQIEALDAYRQLGALLREEFGVDPSLELQRLQTAILRNDLAAMSHDAR